MLKAKACSFSHLQSGEHNINGAPYQSGEHNIDGAPYQSGEYIISLLYIKVM